LQYYIRYNIFRRKEIAMITLKLTQIGNSVGVILPKEALAKLGVGKGDTLYLTEAPDGDMRISAYDQEIARQIALGEQIMDEYRDTFRALAK
jgi:putative addiction module antidote